MMKSERKVFYSIITLFIDKNSIPSDVTLTAENYIDFIPEPKKTLIGKLSE